MQPLHQPGWTQPRVQPFRSSAVGPTGYGWVCVLIGLLCAVLAGCTGERSPVLPTSEAIVPSTRTAEPKTDLSPWWI